MIIKGKYNSALITVDDAEHYTLEQVRYLCNLENLKDSHMVFMPDCCPGIVTPIGGTFTYADSVMPALVSNDIGCGMFTVKLRKDVDFKQLDSVIRENLTGKKKIDGLIESYQKKVDLNELCCGRHIDKSRVLNSLGSLGSGNHFIEIDKDKNGELYMTVHSGSRLLGTNVHEYYMEEGYKILKKEISGFQRLNTFLTGDLMERYIHDVAIVQRFASLNRRLIADIIVRFIRNKADDEMETVHNYIDIDSKIIRKGAVSAKADESLIIPINMRDGILICTGKGNAEWNSSAPHGAGRLLSRKDAKELSMDDYRKDMEGVYAPHLSKATLDEAPRAYKSIDYIMEHIEDTVSVDKVLKPIYNYKEAGKD